MNDDRFGPPYSDAELRAEATLLDEEPSPDLEFVIRWLSGELTRDELVVFESRLAADAAFQEMAAPLLVMRRACPPRHTSIEPERLTRLEASIEREVADLPPAEAPSARLPLPLYYRRWLLGVLTALGVVAGAIVIAWMQRPEWFAPRLQVAAGATAQLSQDVLIAPHGDTRVWWESRKTNGVRQAHVDGPARVMVGLGAAPNDSTPALRLTTDVAVLSIWHGTIELSRDTTGGLRIRMDAGNVGVEVRGVTPAQVHRLRPNQPIVVQYGRALLNP